MSAFAAPVATFHAHSSAGTQVRVGKGSTDAADVAYVKIELSNSTTNQFINVNVTGEPSPVKPEKPRPYKITHSPTLFETADKAGTHKFDVKVVNGSSFTILDKGTLRYGTDRSTAPTYALSYVPHGAQRQGRVRPDAGLMKKAVTRDRTRSGLRGRVAARPRKPR